MSTELLWWCVFFAFVLLLGTSESEAKEPPRANAVIINIQRGDGRPMFIMGLFGPFQSNTSGFHKQFCTVTLKVTDGEEVTVVMHASFADFYCIGELVEVVQDRAGRWLPLFTKLKRQ